MNKEIPEPLLDIIKRYITDDKKDDKQNDYIKKQMRKEIIELMDTAVNKKIIKNGNIDNVFDFYVNKDFISMDDIVLLSRYKETYPSLLKLINSGKIDGDYISKIFHNINENDTELIILDIDNYKEYIDTNGNVFLNYILPKYIENNSIQKELTKDYKVNIVKLQDELKNIHYYPYITNNKVLTYIEHIRKKMKKSLYTVISNYIYYRRLPERNSSYIKDIISTIKANRDILTNHISEKTWGLFINELYNIESDDKIFLKSIEKLKECIKNPYNIEGKYNYLNITQKLYVARTILQMDNIDDKNIEELKTFISDKKIMEETNIFIHICYSNDVSENFYRNIFLYAIKKDKKIDLDKYFFDFYIGQVKNRYIFDYILENIITETEYDENKQDDQLHDIEDSPFLTELLDKYNLWEYVDMRILLKNKDIREIFFNKKYIIDLNNCIDLFKKYLEKKSGDKYKILENKIILEIQKYVDKYDEYKTKWDKIKKKYNVVI